MTSDNSPSLNTEDLTQLNQFLRSDACGKQAMSLSYAHGFISSIICGPNPLPAVEILELLFKEDAFSNLQQHAEALNSMMTLNSSIEDGLNDNAEYKPMLDELNTDDNDIYVDAQRWSLGFVEGLSRFTPLWPDDAKRALQTPLEAVFQLAEMQGIANESYMQLCTSLPDVVKAIHLYWQQNRTAH